MIGVVDNIDRARDNIISMGSVKSFNGMNKTPQFTLRTIRKLVKLWDIDDLYLDEDLAELHRKFGPIPDVSGGEQTDTNHTTEMTGWCTCWAF